MRFLSLFLFVGLVSSCVAQPLPPTTTSYTRDFLTSPDQNTARVKLGMPGAPFVPQNINDIFYMHLNPTGAFVMVDTNNNPRAAFSNNSGLALYYKGGQPAIIIDQNFISVYDTNTTLIFQVATNRVTFSAPVYYSSVIGNTNLYTIAGTGWTNTNAFPCTAIVQATGATITYSDGTNTIRTFTAITQELQLPMNPSYKITAASGLSGVAIVTPR